MFYKNRGLHFISANINGAKWHPAGEPISHHLMRFRLLAVKLLQLYNLAPCR